MGGHCNISPSIIAQHVFCLLGSGNALDLKNHIAYARVEIAVENEITQQVQPATYALFGCLQQSMVEANRVFGISSEALSMQQCMLVINHQKTGTGPEGAKVLLQKTVLHDDPSINSISTTCAAIVSEYLIHGHHVHLVINWPYMARTRYLLRKQAERAGLNWNDVKHLVHSVPCGGTFKPYVKNKGLLRATLWWSKKVFAREVGAWGKALLDPYSEKYNQNRAF